MQTSTSSTVRRFDPRALPISIKITIGLLAALIVGGAITDYLISQVVRDSQADQAERDLQAFSQSQALRTIDLVNGEITNLNRLGSNTQVQQQLLIHQQNMQTQPMTVGARLYQPSSTILTRQVVDFKDQYSEFDSVLLLDKNGYILVAYPTTVKIETVTKPAWPWFITAVNNDLGGTYVSGPIDDELTDARGVHIAIPIYDAQSNQSFATGSPQQRPLIGVLYAVWNMKNAQSLLTPGADRQGILVQGDGLVLMSPFQARGATLDPNMMAQIKGNAATQRFTFTDSNGETALYGFSSVSNLGLGETSAVRPNWIAIVREPASLLEPGIVALQTQLRLLLAAVAVGAGVVVLLSSRALFSPLRQLTNVASEIERGSLDYPIPQFPHDEIGRLAGVFSTLVSQLLRRVRQLKSAVQISRVTVLGHTTEQMLDDVARAVGQQFEYPDVRVFIIDASGQRVRLEAAFGAESERLLKMGYRLALDEETLVGRSMLLNEPLLGGGKEALRQAGLITEHSELSVPLATGGVILGAIHILAGRLRELDEEDIEVMTLVADQLSTAIQNARLLEQSHEQVSEIEALNRRLTRSAWEEYVGESGGMRHTLDQEDHWPGALEEVRRRTEIRAETYTDADGRSVLAAPLILRGEPMGTLAITRPGGEKWSRDEILLLESIASRMAMIAEGIRLVEESSRRAEREQRVNQISASLLQRASSVETVLRSALNELGGALGSDRISLRIGSAPARSDHQIGSGEVGDDGMPQGVSGNGNELSEQGPSTGDTGSNGDGGQ
jgi:GAF domain-containing protein/HAMP domain-containing protein